MKGLDRATAERVQAAMERYAETGQGDVTKLQGEDGFRLRIGDWRSLFDLEDSTGAVVVFRVGHRRDIYR